MTRAKSGSLSVVNGRTKLVGVFTDGDFRRHIASDEKLLTRTLKSVMTPRPISVRESALAMEALKIFNERNIDDLIVVNPKIDGCNEVLQHYKKAKVISIGGPGRLGVDGKIQRPRGKSLPPADRYIEAVRKLLGRGANR